MILVSVALRGSFSLPPRLQATSTFMHIPSRGIDANFSTDRAEQQLYIPSRDRTVHIFGDEPMGASALQELETLDSNYEGLTQTQKYARLQTQLDPTHSYALNIQGTHCGLAVLTRSKPMYFYGVVTNTGEALAFGDYDFATALRAERPGHYWLYRLPVVKTGAVFWLTETLGSRWYTWTKTFNGDLFKCFNALELMLLTRRLEISHA